MTAPASLPPKRPAASLSTRRGMTRVRLSVSGAACGAPKADSPGDLQSLPSCGSISSVETSSSLGRSFEEAGPIAWPICQMGYEVREVLGRGTLAVVYRVARHGDGQEFAAKRVAEVDEERRLVTVGEYNLMRELDHENVLEAKELFDFQTEIWLCTELCAEGNVHSYVKRHGAFGEERCRALASQLVDGVQHLHSKRVVHRDIKPKNLFLGSGASQLKIGDFNSAARVGIAGDRRTASWMLSVRGTPFCLAPELRFNLPWNERVDVWNVGFSVYFMAQAARPFSAGDRDATEALQEGRLPRVSWAGMPAAMAHLVQQCLAVDMRDRPTAMELQWHPAFEARGPASGQSGSDSTVKSVCGLLFSCTPFQGSRSKAKESWRRTALRALTAKNIRTLEKLPSFGIANGWVV